MSMEKPKGLARTSDPSTSHNAANKVDAPKLADLVMVQLRKRPQTSEEVAAALNKELGSITPRFAGLEREGLIYKTGERRKGKSRTPRNIYAVTNE